MVAAGCQQDVPSQRFQAAPQGPLLNAYGWPASLHATPLQPRVLSARFRDDGCSVPFFGFTMVSRQAGPLTAAPPAGWPSLVCTKYVM